MDHHLAELRQMASSAGNGRTETGIPRVTIVQGAVPEHELATIYEPMINLILRGGKTMGVGDKSLHYDPATYFVLSIGLPAVGKVHPGPRGESYLAVSLTLEPSIIAHLLVDAPLPDTRARDDNGFSVAAVTLELLDAWVRLLRLMDQPREIAALAPAYEREILFRVLQGPLGWMLRDIATPGTAFARINIAIEWIRRNFDRPVRMEALAEMSALSISAFHRHFKSVTALSPLQYQKRIRLLRARSLLIARQGNVTTIALSVGYESLAQFSREYARLFGLPPSRDVARIMKGMHSSLQSSGAPLAWAEA